MEVYRGIYIKDSGEEREAEVYAIKDLPGKIEGIDLTKFTEEEKKEFIDFIKNYETKMTLYGKKAYRTFKRENFRKLALHGIDK